MKRLAGIVRYSAAALTLRVLRCSNPRTPKRRNTRPHKSGALSPPPKERRPPGRGGRPHGRWPSSPSRGRPGFGAGRGSPDWSCPVFRWSSSWGCGGSSSGAQRAAQNPCPALPAPARLRARRATLFRRIETLRMTARWYWMRWPGRSRPHALMAGAPWEAGPRPRAGSEARRRWPAYTRRRRSRGGRNPGRP